MAQSSFARVFINAVSVDTPTGLNLKCFFLSLRVSHGNITPELSDSPHLVFSDAFVVLVVTDALKPFHHIFHVPLIHMPAPPFRLVRRQGGRDEGYTDDRAKGDDTQMNK